MLRYTLLALAFAAFAFPAFAAEVENPYKNAKVGDWAEYKSNTDSAGLKIESKMKHTVTAKTDKEVTILVDMDTAGQKSTPEKKIDLTQPYDPNANPQPGIKPAKVEKLKEGDETLKIGGKEYKSHWVESKSTLDLGGQTIEAEAKTWYSKDAPLDGLVKTEMKLNNGVKTVMELTASGAAK